MKYRLFWWGLEYSPSCFCNVHVTILLQACRMNSYNYCFFFFWEDAEMLLTCVLSMDNCFLLFFFLFAQTYLYLL